jgi:pimeloyl-ACP methyl ester carboxylesterase
MKPLLKSNLLSGLIFTIATTGIISANASAGEFVTINNNALYYEIYGDSSSPYYPILLLHGGMADSDTWSEQIPELVANDFQVIALDSRGHGRSRGETDAITYALMADDVAKFIGFLQDSSNPIINTDKVNIVGWSDGGVIALNLCKVHETLVHKAVVIGTNVQSYNAFTASFESLLNAPLLFNFSMDLFSRPSWIDKKQSEWNGTRAFWRQNWPMFRDSIRALWQTPCYIPEDQGKTCLQSLDTIDTPVYVVVGENEETILEDHTNAIYENLPNAQLKIFEVDEAAGLEAGHNLPRQQPVAFNALVVSYFSN